VDEEEFDLNDMILPPKGTDLMLCMFYAMLSTLGTPDLRAKFTGNNPTKPHNLFLEVMELKYGGHYKPEMNQNVSKAKDLVAEKQWDGYSIGNYSKYLEYLQEHGELLHI
jgi:hypothetical protein